MRKLIINADDFGFSSHTVDWTVKCFEAGVLSSATIMAGAEAARSAVDYAKRNPQWSFGLHLCLTDERPVSAPAEISSLVTGDGLLWPTRSFILRTFLGLISRPDLETEIRAQVWRLRELGVEPSHVDGHGHMHRLPFVLKSLIRLSSELGLKRVRPAQDLYYSPHGLPLGRWLNRWVNRPLRKSFRAPEHFLMMTGKITAEDREWFRKELGRLPASGITEIGIHPGVDEEWRRLDIDFLLKQGSELIQTNHVELISYFNV